MDLEIWAGGRHKTGQSLEPGDMSKPVVVGEPGGAGRPQGGCREQGANGVALDVRPGTRGVGSAAGGVPTGVPPDPRGKNHFADAKTEGGMVFLGWWVQAGGATLWFLSPQQQGGWQGTWTWA